MDKFQYKISVNGAEGRILDSSPDKDWKRIAEFLEARGGHAILYRRFITTPDILPLLADKTGIIRLGDVVVCPWRIIAELELK
jgi:hypothetical protein